LNPYYTGCSVFSDELQKFSIANSSPDNEGNGFSYGHKILNICMDASQEDVSFKASTNFYTLSTPSIQDPVYI